MSLLRNIENRIEGIFERGFRRAFRSSLQPVELARKLAREMDDHKTISVSRVYVPNEFAIFLSEEDREGFASYEHALLAELASYLDQHASGGGMSLVASCAVRLETDADLRPGEFGIACRMAESPEGVRAPGAAPAPAVAPRDAEDDAGEVAPEPEPAPPPPPPAQPYRPLAGVSGTQVISAQDVQEAGVPETMTLEMNGGRHRISKRVSTLGRSRDCDIIVPDPNVSRVHAELRHIGMDYHLVDMGSTNGTEVNGRPVRRHALADGDVIVMGTTELRVELR